MVKCNKIDGEPCSCELEEPCIKYLVQSITSNIIKYVLRTIATEDIDELQHFVQMPDAAIYLGLYVEELSKRRSELEEPYTSYMTQTIVINILRFVLRTITHAEREELEQFARMPDAGGYLRLYIEELDNEREIIGDIVLETI